MDNNPSAVTVKDSGYAYELDLTLKHSFDVSVEEKFHYTKFDDNCMEIQMYNDAGTELEGRSFPLFDFVDIEGLGLNYAKQITDCERSSLASAQYDNYRKALWYVRDVLLQPRRHSNVPKLKYVGENVENYQINYSLPLARYLMRIGDNKVSHLDQNEEIMSLRLKETQNLSTDKFQTLYGIETAQRHWYHRLANFNNGKIVSAKYDGESKGINDVRFNNEQDQYTVSIPKNLFAGETEFPDSEMHTIYKHYALLNFKYHFLNPEKIDQKLQTVNTCRFPDLNKVRTAYNGFLVRLPRLLQESKATQDILANFILTYKEELEGVIGFTTFGLSTIGNIPIITDERELIDINSDYAIFFNILDTDESRLRRNEGDDKFLEGVYIYVNHRAYDPENHLKSYGKEQVYLRLKNDSKNVIKTFGFYTVDDSETGSVESTYISKNKIIMLYSMEFIQSNPMPSPDLNGPKLHEMPEEVIRDKMLYPLYSAKAQNSLRYGSAGFIVFEDLIPYFLATPEKDMDTGKIQLWTPIAARLQDSSEFVIWFKIDATLATKLGGDYMHITFNKAIDRSSIFITENKTIFDDEVCKSLVLGNAIFQEATNSNDEDPGMISLVKTVIDSLTLYPGKIHNSYKEYLGGLSGGGSSQAGPVTTYRVVDLSTGQYELQAEDFDGRTLLLCKNNTHTIVVNVPPSGDAFKGKSIVVRRSANSTEQVTLQPRNGAIFSPPDMTVLRRAGSTITLTYVGNNTYEVFGELS